MSTSRSSNSLINNSYDNSHLFMSRKNYNSEFEYIKCKCDLVAPCQEAWREGTLDSGRRFFGCSQFKDPSKRCNFFVWADPPYPERTREVIQYLKQKLRAKNEELERAMAELSFMEKKMLVLNEECVSLRCKNAEAEAVGKSYAEAGAMLQKENKSYSRKKLLVIVVIAWIIFSLFK
ncbi:GRF-type domain-containing protein [Heracleum sosnowskyi]|uniref:GRF-type domain-containing protein n=1 Tax=Heracleum sosnowskyi TaxID=360622 RepID=A0AAD8I5G6_9APIA|nr:GRF-type domain-containing protein [Heracleum sosnowskyi]